MQFNIDLDRLQKSYRIIQAEIHPDKFVSGSQIEKNQSLIKSTEVNDAYQILKNPIKRARYLIKINLNSEENNSTLTHSLLMQQMEWEEHLEDIEKNNKELDQFKLAINKKYKEYSLLLSKQIDNDQNWNEAAITIDKLYFVEKLLHKINIALN